MYADFDERVQLRNQAMALYESSMDSLIHEMMEKGISSKELANELGLSEKEIQECQNVLQYRRKAYEFLAEEREKIEQSLMGIGSSMLSIGEKIAEVRKDKGISKEELASKLHISISELVELEKCKMGEQTFGKGKVVDRQFLKKVSGVLGVPYTVLIWSAGYNIVEIYPEFYTEEGEEINVMEMIFEVYYKDPSKIARLRELLK